MQKIRSPGKSLHRGAFAERMVVNKDKLLVLGAAGGVGLAAVHLGMALGAEVIAAASNEKKLEVVKRYGADYTINYAEQSLRDVVKQMTGGKGVDVIYDPVGGDYFDQAVRLVAFNGTYLVIGFSSGRIPMVPANIVLLKGIRMVGVHWGRSFEITPGVNKYDFEHLLQMARDKDFKPLISKVFSLNQAAQALNALLRREAIGKIVLKVK